MHALKASASPRPLGPCARPAGTPRAAAASAAPRGRALPAAAAAADDSSSEAKPAPAAAAAAAATALLLAATATLAPAPPPALAAPGEKLGEFAASGLLFKDSVEVSALADRDLPGAVVYISDFKRSLTDKLSKDFFNEPSQASLTCAFVGESGGGGGGGPPSSLASEPTAALAKRLGGAGGGGVEVFAERKGLNVFRDKTLRVRRLFDADRRAAVYVAYSTRLGTAGDEGGVSTGRYRTSVCVVPLPAYAAPAPAAAEAAAAAAE